MSESPPPKVPTIKIGERDFPVPALVPWQQAIVLGACVRWLKMMSRIIREPETFTADDYNLGLTIIYFGCVQRQDPKFTMDMLKNCEGLTWKDIIKAVNVISEQTGFIKQQAEVDPEGTDTSLTPEEKKTSMSETKEPSKT